jgi:Na+/H+ antiporter NhaC
MVVMPPLVVLASVFLTKRINTSLILGILSAAFITYPTQPASAFSLLVERSWTVILSLLSLYLFLFLIGGLIALIGINGGTYALTHARALRTLKTKRSVQRLSIFASLLLFIDDYLSNLTVGNIMRPLTDRFSIPRAKLAYLIHTFSTGLIMFVPLSSWVAVVTSSLAQAGVQATTTGAIINLDPFSVYLKAIPYLFYGIFMLLSALIIIEYRLSFGLMGKHEAIAASTGNLFGGKEPIKTVALNENTAHGTLTDLFVPLASLIFFCATAILWTSGHWLFGGTKNLIEALTTNEDAIPALTIGAGLAFITSIIYTFFVKKHSPKKLLLTIIQESDTMMRPAIIMVTLANILGMLMKLDLQTGYYLASLITTTLPLWLLPLTIFVFSLCLTLILGSAWATMILLIPIALPMVIELSHAALPATLSTVPMLLPTLGALFSGAICGNQISPFADTTIMAATSAGCYFIDHLATQVSYAIPAIIGAAASFVAIGILITPEVSHPLIGSLVVGLIVTGSTLTLLNRFLSPNRKSLL